MLSRSAGNENENIFPARLGRWEELAELDFPLIWNYHSSLALRKQNGDFLCGSCPSWGRRNRYFMLDLWRSALDHVVDKNSSHHILWRHLFVLCQRSETTFNIFQQLTPNREWSVMARVSFEGQKKATATSALPYQNHRTFPEIWPENMRRGESEIYFTAPPWERRWWSINLDMFIMGESINIPPLFELECSRHSAWEVVTNRLMWQFYLALIGSEGKIML